MSAPLAYRWSGDSFQILPRHAKAADERFTIGEVYTLEHVEERSAKSHRFYFASVNQAWVNLPEAVAEHFPTADHLRRYALIKSGFYDRRSIVASSKAEARRLAAFVRPMDEFAVVTVSDCSIDVYTAKSQSMKAMGKADFARSKEAVLALLAEMIGVQTKALERTGEPA
jgi:hypothetical protein